MNAAVDRPALVLLLQRCNAARAAGAVDLAAEAALAQPFAPSLRLAVYGTLAPGASNHREVAHLGGSWHPGHVRGVRGNRGDPVFTWSEQAPPVPVQVLIAAGLPAHWPALDAFEGSDYWRILVPVQLRDGALAVANLYAAKVPVDPTAGHSC